MSWREWLRRSKPQAGDVGRQQPVSRGKQAGAAAMTWAPPGASGTVVRVSDGGPDPEVHQARPAIPRFSVDDRIADTYQVKRVIEGGMGTVYVCYHERWKVDLVVKVPQEKFLADPDTAHRIEREAEAWTELGLHPHIAYCYYVHPLDGVPLVVIEYLDGGNLRDWIGEGRCADLKVGLDQRSSFVMGWSMPMPGG